MLARCRPGSNNGEVWNQLRVFFDNSLSRRGALAGWTVFAIFLAIAFGALVTLLPRLLDTLDVTLGGAAAPFRLLLDSLSNSLGVPLGETLLGTVANLWFWFVGLMIFGTIFAWRTSALDATKKRVLAGRTPLNDRGHFVILGWSTASLTIVAELARSAPPRTKLTVAILATDENQNIRTQVEEMLDRERLRGKVRVLIRTGNPASTNDLNRVNLRAAKGVAIVDSPALGDKYAGVAVATVVSKMLGEDSETQVVFEASGSSAREVARRAIGSGALVISGLDILTKVMAQSARHDAIGECLTDLLNFGGSELYTIAYDDGTQRRYSDLVETIRGVSLVGVFHGGELELNPRGTTIVSSGDRLIAVAKDSSELLSARFDGVVADELPVAQLEEITAVPRNIAAIGLSDHLDSLVGNLGSFLPSGTTFTAISERESPAHSETIGSVTVVRSTVRSLITPDIVEAVPADTHKLLLLADTEFTDVTEVIDAHTLVSLELLRRGRSQGRFSSGITAEVLSSANRESFSGLDAAGLDIVVGDEVTGMLISQGLANSDIVLGLLDLLDPATGSALAAFAVESPREGLTYQSLITAGLRVGVSVVGWRYSEAGSWRLELNPSRESPVPPEAELQVLAVGSVK